MLKTKKSAAKRFKITSTGKVLFRPAGINHFRAKKSSNELRAKKVWKKLEGKLAKQIKRLLPYH